MRSLFREELERKEEYMQTLSESMCHLNKGAYYEETLTRRDVENGERVLLTQWVPYTRSEMASMLLKTGFEEAYLIPANGTSLGEKREHEALIRQELEDVLSNIPKVDYAGPVAGRKAGIREFNGTRILVTEDPKLVIPKKGEWSDGLGQIFKRMFGEEQIDYFYSWCKRALQSVLSGKAMSLHFFAMCGPVNSGKTWLQEAVINEMLGGYGSPNQYMSEGTAFNADLFKAPHLMLSDAKGSITFEKRRTFGSFVKDIVANTGHRCHGKGEKAIELDPIWVATCSCNTSPIERLRILPPLDDDIRDKMIITLINPGSMPMQTATAEGKEEFRVWTRKQLPAFAWWLLNEYIIPPEIALPDRFGIEGYCHPEIERHLLQLSPDARVRDHIHDTLFFGKGENHQWQGTAEELKRKFETTEEGRKVVKSIKGRFTDVLPRLAAAYPAEFVRKKNNTQRFWMIKPPTHE